MSVIDKKHTVNSVMVYKPFTSTRLGLASSCCLVVVPPSAALPIITIGFLSCADSCKESNDIRMVQKNDFFIMLVSVLKIHTSYPYCFTNLRTTLFPCSSVTLITYRPLVMFFTSITSCTLSTVPCCTRCPVIFEIL